MEVLAQEDFQQNAARMKAEGDLEHFGWTVALSQTEGNNLGKAKEEVVPHIELLDTALVAAGKNKDLYLLK